jgi:hypothetical protein
MLGAEMYQPFNPFGVAGTTVLDVDTTGSGCVAAIAVLVAERPAPFTATRFSVWDRFTASPATLALEAAGAYVAYADAESSRNSA